MWKKRKVPDVEFSTRPAGAGVIQSDAHQDGLSKGAQRNIHLQTHRKMNPDRVNFVTYFSFGNNFALKYDKFYVVALFSLMHNNRSSLNTV